MSKWGEEEKETLTAINEIGFSGNILNVAAGDGRFNNKLLELATSVVAIDNCEEELEILKNNCLEQLRGKLRTKTVDITKKLPFDENAFDGIFCTGTLHLFEREIVIDVLRELSRVLKRDGKFLVDFATDIERLDKNGEKVVFDGEGSYSTEDAIDLFRGELKEFSISIDVATFVEENLDDTAGYQVIRGKFLIVKGYKK